MLATTWFARLQKVHINQCSLLGWETVILLLSYWHPSSSHLLIANKLAKLLCFGSISIIQLFLLRVVFLSVHHCINCLTCCTQLPSSLSNMIISSLFLVLITLEMPQPYNNDIILLSIVIEWSDQGTPMYTHKCVNKTWKFRPTLLRQYGSHQFSFY